MVGTECPSREDLTAYLSGGLSDQRAESLSEHLETCTKCKAELETLNSAGDPLIAALRRRPVENVHQREPQLQEVIARAKALGAPPAEGRARPNSPPAAKPPAGAAVQPAQPVAYDPYYQWLGIAPKDQPPNHYRLLGIDRFEENLDVIDSAADRQTAHLRTFQIGKYSELSQRLLNEVAKAKICLLDPAKKAAYDAKLKQQLQPAQAVPPSAPPATPPPKNQLGEYQLLAKLGSGGMGTVYKARHTKLEKLVALKVLAKGSLVNDEAVARFDREMKAVGQLNHPNIVQAHDAREIAGTRFLVMEYVEGLDLAKLVDACGPLPVADACELVRQTVLGLDHAHQHGLVHRDIKPANLMLDSQGQVKILDLGLAMFQPGQLSGVERITASGQAMGTIDYMAPEQALASRDVDIRADLYSLGCTLYKLLSGRAPFSGPKYQDQVSKLMAHAREPVPPIRKLRPDVPAHVAAVLDRLLAKDPAQRYATPAELVEAITPLASGSNLRELMARARRSSAAPAAPAGDPAAAEASSAHLETLSNIKSQARSITWFGLRLGGLIPPRIRQPGWAVAAAGGGAVLMLLAIVLYIHTNHGLVKIEISDPKAKVEVKVDGETITIAAVPDLLTLRVGDHAIQVVSDRFATVTQSFTVRRGALEVVRVTLEPKADPPLAVAPFDAAQAKQNQEAWAKHLGIPIEQTNSIGMKLTLIPPGEFLMGSTPEEIAAEIELAKGDNGYCDRVPAEAPRHQVKISKPFCLGMYPVMQGEYEKAMGVNPSSFTTKLMDGSTFNPSLDPRHVEQREREAKPLGGKDTSSRPVEMVSWDEAVEFCRRLSALPAERAARRVYRLPTEAEWEYACRAGMTTRWYCGDDEAGLVEVAWFNKNSGGMTHPVGEKRPNAWGLYDMSGNVYQWCADWYSKDYYAQSPPNDPSGPPAGSDRVVRGGNWNYVASSCRSAYRHPHGPAHRHPAVGFRVVAEVAGKAEGGNGKAEGSTTSAPPIPNPQSPIPPPAVAPFDAAKAKQHQEAWAKYLNLPVEETNSIGMTLVLIPAGEFLMGSTDSDKDADPGEKPQHRVRITRPFYLGKYLVTQAQWQAVMGGNPSHFKGPENPVEMVSWNDCQVFLDKLNAKSDGRGGKFQLPTEAQWEYACRAGTTTRHYFGDEETGLGEYAWYLANSGGKTHPVGEKKPNAWGLYDMHGNVLDWCGDWYDGGYYASSPTDDPTGPSRGSLRVHRGGSWGSPPPGYCRSARRDWGTPDSRRNDLGFRVARVPAETDEKADQRSVGAGAMGNVVGIRQVSPQSLTPNPQPLRPPSSFPMGRRRSSSGQS